MTEEEFMDPANWDRTHNGNAICTVEMESDDGNYTMEYTVVVFPREADFRPAAWGFVIFYGPEGKVFGRNRYTTEKAARYWAWTRMELLT